MVYRNFLQLLPFTPAYGYVKEGEIAYFLYKATESNSTLLFSVSGGGTGLDLLLNKGLTKGLPTLQNRDF